jgi:hypothetical protein
MCWVRTARSWTRKVHGYVRERRLNAIVQEVGGNPPYNAGVLQSFQATHRVEVMFLGVPQALSRQGILSRYHQQIHDRGHGRLTPDGNHALAYEGIPELARLIDDGHLAERVRVFRRGENSPRHQNSLTLEGDWADPSDWRPPSKASVIGPGRRSSRPCSSATTRRSLPVSPPTSGGRTSRPCCDATRHSNY